MVAHPRTPLRAHQLRTLNAPRPLDVRGAADQPPAALRFAALPGGRARAGAWLQVERALERWRIDDEWWREPISRRYYRLLLADGRILVVFCDLLSGLWYAQHDRPLDDLIIKT
ncbi:MAG TPA: hypothetical protein VFK80_00460 [Limnochordia bacterium]|nr:hypothetical protein [Limnochordia bacterium]